MCTVCVCVYERETMHPYKVVCGYAWITQDQVCLFSVLPFASNKYNYSDCKAKH